MGVFTYSQESGTPAGTFENQVPEEVKNKRREKIMLLQQQISLKKNKSFSGKILEMLVEQIEHHENGKARIAGRSFRDAPEIDGQLYVELNKKTNIPSPGEFIEVKVIGCDEYDLYCSL